MSAAVNEAWPTQRNAEEAKKNLRNWGKKNETKVWEREFRGATKRQWTSEPTLKYRERQREAKWMRLLW